MFILNQSNDKIAYRLWIDGNPAEVTSQPHSIQTLVVE